MISQWFLSALLSQCHGTLVCYGWTAGVLWEFGGRSLVSRATGRCEPLPSAQCALSVVRELMACLDSVI